MPHDESGRADSREGTGLRRMLVAGALSLVVAMGIGRFAYTPILPAMQERFGLTSAAAGRGWPPRWP